MPSERAEQDPEDMDADAPKCDRCDTTFAPYYFGSHHQPSCPYYAPPAIPKDAEAHDMRYGHGA